MLPMTTERAPEQVTGQETHEKTTDRWHRDHPTFVALAGFFTGMLSVTIVPGAWAGLLRLLFRYDTAEELFPYVLVILVVPLGLVLVDRTRRFGAYMFVGMVLTTVVVLCVASLVLYFMVRSQA
jgi:hypothetical protein